jgi:taurine-pyruvate aminotransferase
VDIDKILGEHNDNELLDWAKRSVLRLHPWTGNAIAKDANGISARYSDGEFMDFRSSYLSVNVGYSNQEIISAAIEQLRHWTGPTRDGYNEPQIKLARLITELTPTNLTRAHFTNSGSEANEVAFKVVRAATGRNKIISLYGSYHGATLGALSASGTPIFKGKYDPGAPGFIHVPPPYSYRCPLGIAESECGCGCAKVMETAIEYEGPDSIAGVIMETILAGSGVIIPSIEYLAKVRAMCDRYDIPLILDEVIVGLGRTGKTFAFEHYGISPDVLVLGKGLSSSYAPIAAVVTTDKLSAKIDYEKYAHNITMENNPLSCAIALANIAEILRNNLVENAARTGSYLLEKLKEIATENEFLGEVRGLGLLVGLEIVKSKDSKEADQRRAQHIVDSCLKSGLRLGLTNRRAINNSVIIFAPPLCVTQSEIDRAIEVFRRSARDSYSDFRLDQATLAPRMPS